MSSTVTSAVTDAAGFSKLNQLVLRIYAKELLLQAQPVMRFEQFAEVKNQLGVQPGNGITFFKYNNLQRGGALREDEPITTQALTGSQVTITVQEYGNGAAMTNLLTATSFDDVMSSTTRLLGIDYAATNDIESRDTLELSGNVVYAGDAANEDAVSDTDYLTLEEIKDAVEILETNNASKIDNDHWICFVSPHQSRRLRDDPDWINVGKLDPPRLYKGEIGRVDDVVFINTTQVSVVENAVGTSVDIHTAIMFGSNAFGKAVALPVELRTNGVKDFGRIEELAWYNIMGYGIINEDNIVLIKTA